MLKLLYKKKNKKKKHTFYINNIGFDVRNISYAKICENISI